MWTGGPGLVGRRGGSARRGSRGRLGQGGGGRGACVTRVGCGGRRHARLARLGRPRLVRC